MALKEKNFEDESEKLISEGWINAEISLLVRDKEKTLKFFDEITEQFETTHLKPVKITLNKIEESPFLGVISINFLVFDFRTLANTVMQFAPIGVEIKKESVNLSIEDINTILLDVCDIVKTYRYLAEKPIKKEIIGSEEEHSTEKLTALMSFESTGKTHEEVENSVNELLKKLRSEKNIYVSDEYIDEIISETTEEGKIFLGNFEVEIIAPIIEMVGYVVKYHPTSIEMTNPEKITLNKKEIYLLLSKLILVSQKYSEKIMKKEAVEKKSEFTGSDVI